MTIIGGRRGAFFLSSGLASAAEANSGVARGEAGVTHEGVRGHEEEHGAHVHEVGEERAEPANDPGASILQCSRLSLPISFDNCLDDYLDLSGEGGDLAGVNCIGTYQATALRRTTWYSRTVIL